MSKLTRLCGLSVLACLASGGLLAQDNSFAVQIQNNAMMQANLTRQMINLGGAPTTGARGFSPASCMPPADLQRGVDGHVPVELQRDPRYQEYLRCKQGIPPAGQSAPMTAAAPSSSPARHLPITATDFVPTRPGHPAVDQIIHNLDIAPEQRQRLHDGTEEAFRRVAARYRDHNLAVSVALAYTISTSTLNGGAVDPSPEFVYSVNDQLAQSPKFALLTAQEKQDESDKLIFQSTMIIALREEGAHNSQSKQQAQELSRVVLRQFANEPAGQAPPPQNRVVLGVKVGPLIPAVAVAAGYPGTDGAFVVDVTPGSAAARAGINRGDIVVRVGDLDIKTAKDLPGAMASVSPGSVVPVRVFRQGGHYDLNVAF